VLEDAPPGTNRGHHPSMHHLSVLGAIRRIHQQRIRAMDYRHAGRGYANRQRRNSKEWEDYASSQPKTGALDGFVLAIITLAVLALAVGTGVMGLAMLGM